MYRRGEPHFEETFFVRAWPTHPLQRRQRMGHPTNIRSSDGPRRLRVNPHAHLTRAPGGRADAYGAPADTSKATTAFPQAFGDRATHPLQGRQRMGHPTNIRSSDGP